MKGLKVGLKYEILFEIWEPQRFVKLNCNFWERTVSLPSSANRRRRNIENSLNIFSTPVKIVKIHIMYKTFSFWIYSCVSRLPPTFVKWRSTKVPNAGHKSRKAASIGHLICYSSFRKFYFSPFVTFLGSC